MRVGRILSSCAVLVAVAGCTVVAIGMSRDAETASDSTTPFSMPTMSSQPVPTPAARTPYRTPSSAPKTAAAHRAAPPAHASVAAKPTHARPTTHPTVPSTHKQAPPPAAKVSPKLAAKPAAKPALVRGQSLPVAGRTYSATRVITVTASAFHRSTATLQAWDKAPGGGWLKHGTPMLAHVGSEGLSARASESRSATPVGTFRLTQAFGAYANPGTKIPYFRTNSSDWWISQAGPLYNTHQHCASGCGFTHGAPNEHLAYELPYYRYAVVIDYNTRNAPGGVQQGKGSAFFLHVTDGRATAGCVAISQARLVSIMKWLTPTAHPRILIGVA